MQTNYFKIMISIINIAILVAIVIGIYKVILVFRGFINRNNEMDKKMDVILSKLQSKEKDTNG